MEKTFEKSTIRTFKFFLVLNPKNRFLKPTFTALEETDRQTEQMSGWTREGYIIRKIRKEQTCDFTQMPVTLSKSHQKNWDKVPETSFESKAEIWGNSSRDQDQYRYLGLESKSKIAFSTTSENNGQRYNS